MALLREEPTFPAGKLLLAGVPSFIIAMAISLVTHRMAHSFGGTAFCGTAVPAAGAGASLTGPEFSDGACGMAALSGQAWTFGLALAAFILFLRYPRNLFLISLAFINATARIPEAVTMFLQYLVHSRTVLRADESLALSLIGLTDPTIPMVIMCAWSLLLLFFSITIVHDVKAVRYKWPIAAALFATMGFIETGVLWMLRPVVGG